MTARRLVLAVAVAVAPSSVPASADDLTEALRPCTRADVIGVWEVVRLGVPPGTRVDRSAPAYRPFQRWVFTDDDTARHLASTRRITRALHRELEAAAEPGTWAVDEAGRLLLQPAGQAAVETSECRVLQRLVADPRSRGVGLPGDLLLTDEDGDGQPRHRRQLRRLDPPPD